MSEISAELGIIHRGRGSLVKQSKCLRADVPGNHNKQEDGGISLLSCSEVLSFIFIRIDGKARADFFNYQSFWKPIR